MRPISYKLKGEKDMLLSNSALIERRRRHFLRHIVNCDFILRTKTNFENE